MNQIFTKYRNLAQEAGVPASQKKSLEWFRKRIRKDRIRDMDRVTEGFKRARIREGEMVTYRYDPLLKEKLKYYDVQPLIVILEIYLDGWLGVNVHYLPPEFRAKLFYELQYKKKNMRVIAEQLKKHPISYPAIKRYKAQKVLGEATLIPKEEWDIAIQLPYERFVGASLKQVWNKSRSKI